MRTAVAASSFPSLECDEEGGEWWRACMAPRIIWSDRLRPPRPFRPLVVAALQNHHHIYIVVIKHSNVDPDLHRSALGETFWIRIRLEKADSDPGGKNYRKCAKK